VKKDKRKKTGNKNEHFLKKKGNFLVQSSSALLQNVKNKNIIFHFINKFGWENNNYQCNNNYNNNIVMPYNKRRWAIII